MATTAWAIAHWKGPHHRQIIFDVIWCGSRLCFWLNFPSHFTSRWVVIFDTSKSENEQKSKRARSLFITWFPACIQAAIALTIRHHSSKHASVKLSTALNNSESYHWFHLIHFEKWTLELAGCWLRELQKYFPWSAVVVAMQTAVTNESTLIIFNADIKN